MKKILIVDDDPDIRKSITFFLKKKYELREAGSRKEGKKVLQEFLPDLVIVDVMMEERDSGFELVREIRTDQQLKHIKILMSTNVDNEMRMDFKQFAGNPDWLPVDEYVLKPINPKAVLSKIEQLLEK